MLKPKKNRAAERALDFLGEAVRRAKTLELGEARAEDLHRFRVSLRRLRVHLKVHEQSCRVSRKMRRFLRKFFRRTNDLRDAQVESDWIAAFAARRPRRGTTGGSLAAAADRRRPRALGPGFWRRFAKLAKAVRRALGKAGRKGFGGARYREDNEKAAKSAFREISRRIVKLERVSDVLALHKARIAAKRLRYILESVEGRIERLPRFRDVKGLQAILGEIHDLANIEKSLRTIRREQPGLHVQATAAIGRARSRRTVLFSRARREWLKR